MKFPIMKEKSVTPNKRMKLPTMSSALEMGVKSPYPTVAKVVKMKYIIAIILLSKL
jgi:hypothetical protein